MLVFFTLIIYAILGLGALAIDLGYLTLTRVQMESLTDAAALEGLRHRDSLGDQGRRISARRTAAWMADNDFDPSSDPLGFGAGPELPVTGGLAEPDEISELGASKSIALTAAPSVYKPDLQLNDAENLAYGDMVSGTFLGGPPSEDSDYIRTDFSPAPAADSATAPAFLVRLRRTNNRQGLDQMPGVSASGGPLPLLLGLGTLISSGGVRVEGLTVRGTSIADARPAWSVGRPYPLTASTPTIPGAAWIVLTASFWQSLTPESATSVTVDAATGFVMSDGTRVGHFNDLSGHPVLSIGAPLPPSVPAAPLSVNSVGYVPIAAEVNGTERVIGFGRLRQNGTLPGTVEVTRLASQIAPRNATRHLIGGLPALSEAERAELLNANAGLEEALLAPVLVR